MEKQVINIPLPMGDVDTEIVLNWNSEPCFAIQVINDVDKTLFHCATLPLNGDPSTTATLVIMD